MTTAAVEEVTVKLVCVAVDCDETIEYRATTLHELLSGPLERPTSGWKRIVLASQFGHCCDGFVCSKHAKQIEDVLSFE